MAIRLSRIRIAAAVGAVALGAGLVAPASAVVVVGGDNGWEVSFDGDVQAFDRVGNDDQSYIAAAADRISRRPRSLLGRNALLNDLTPFGLSFSPGADLFGSASFGRARLGYTHTDFATDSGSGNLLGDEHIPRLEAEMSYSIAFTGGNVKAWVDALWQDTHSSCSGTAVTLGGMTAQCDDFNPHSWGIGTRIGYRGFALLGYYHDSKGLGLAQPFDQKAVWIDTIGNTREREGDSYYLQGTYSFSGKTKVGVSYGAGNLDAIDSAGITTNSFGTHPEHQLWTVGVYHDVSSWLRLIAEYNRGDLNTHAAGKNPGANTFSVGSLLFW